MSANANHDESTQSSYSAKILRVPHLGDWSAEVLISEIKPRGQCESRLISNRDISNLTKHSHKPTSTRRWATLLGWVGYIIKKILVLIIRYCKCHLLSIIFFISVKKGAIKDEKRIIKLHFFNITFNRKIGYGIQKFTIERTYTKY